MSCWACDYSSWVRPRNVDTESRSEWNHSLGFPLFLWTISRAVHHDQDTWSWSAPWHASWGFAEDSTSCAAAKAGQEQKIRQQNWVYSWRTSAVVHHQLGTLPLFFLNQLTDFGFLTPALLFQKKTEKTLYQIVVMLRYWTVVFIYSWMVC